MTVARIIDAIGTLHCPHCQMPMFANPLASQGEVAAPELSISFVSPFVMLVDTAFADGSGLIELAEGLRLWAPSAVAGSEGVVYGTNRNNDFMLLSSQLDPSLAGFEESMRRLFHAAARAYARAVGHLELRSDLGYQLLRYGPGQHFHEHVDAMPAADVYGQRQLSAILYLNDDFEGGELILPRQDLVYKPKAGTLVLFPSGFCFPHASDDVARGVKYSVATWFI